MDQKAYKLMRIFFKSFTSSYIADAVDPEPFQVKIIHTANVCENMKNLAKSLGWSGEKLYLALAAALLHDIGRFPQYKKHGTFSDARSENHGGACPPGTSMMVDF